MGYILSVAASAAMLLFVTWVLILFLRKIGIAPDTKRIVRNALTVFAAEFLFYVASGLMFAAYFGTENAFDVSVMYCRPEPTGFIYDIFRFFAAIPTTFLLSQPLLGAYLTAWCFTWISACLWEKTWTGLSDRTSAMRLVRIIVFSPIGIYALLPGTLPLLLLIVSVLLYIILRNKKPFRLHLSFGVYGTLLSLSAVLSGVCLFLLITGRGI